jgi:hypothetical protein
MNDSSELEATPTDEPLPALDFEKLPQLLMSPYLLIEVQDAMTQEGPVRRVSVQVAHDGQIKGARATLGVADIKEMENSEGDIMNQLVAATCQQLNLAITPKAPGLIIPTDALILP